MEISVLKIGDSVKMFNGTVIGKISNIDYDNETFTFDEQEHFCYKRIETVNGVDCEDMTLYNSINDMNDVMEEIMDTFDFDKVCSVMELLDWKWVHDGVLITPSINIIKQEARHLMQTCIDEKARSISCGGFEVLYHEDTQEMELRFVVETCNSQVFGINESYLY